MREVERPKALPYDDFVSGVLNSPLPVRARSLFGKPKLPSGLAFVLFVFRCIR